MATNTNQRQQQYETAVVAPEDIEVEIVQRPSYTKRIIRKTLFYTVGAIAEPQEQRYSIICVFFSLIAVFIGGMLFKTCK